MDTVIAAPVAQAAPAKLDGRNLRSAQTKRRIIEAALTLIAQGEKVTVAATARQAGVSVRSVFQHYKDIDSLHNVARERILSRLIDRFDDLQVQENLDVMDLTSRVQDVVESLYSLVTFRDSQMTNQINWVFENRPPFSFLSNAEAMHDNRIRSLVSKILKEDKNHSYARSYAQLSDVLEIQLHLKNLSVLLTRTSVSAVVQMLVGIITEFRRVSSRSS